MLECARLRVKDLDLERAEIRIRCGNGAKDRLVPLTLAHNLIEPFRCHLAAVRKQHEADLRAGAGWVEQVILLPGGSGKGPGDSHQNQPDPDLSPSAGHPLSCYPDPAKTRIGLQ